MKRVTFVRSALALAAIVGIGGCAQNPGTAQGGGGAAMASTASSSSAPASPTASAQEQVYTATLSSAEEVPPATDSQGKGTAEVRVNPATNAVAWKVTWVGHTGPATMGHIHGPASKGQNAGVVVPFTNVAGQSSAEGRGNLTQAQYGDLAAGLYYVNIHTAAHPGGEIRGQLQRQQ
jgi:hypothetical protein